MRADGGVGGWSQGDGLSKKIAEFMGPRQRPEIGDTMLSGVKAGVAGSLFAWIMLALTYVNSGGDPTIPVRLIALRALGDVPFVGHGLAIALGVAALLAAGACFGAVFGVIMSKLVGRVGVLAATGVGTTYGVLLWIIAVFVVAGYLAPEVLMLYDQHALVWAFAIYGAWLGLLGRS